MSTSTPRTGLQLRSLVKPSGELELSLASVVSPTPAADEVLVRIEATPINPSDIGLLFGAADMSTAKASGTPQSPVITATIPERLMKSMAGRLGQSMPVGNEGAGTVVAAGSDPAAQALIGRTVAVLGGASLVIGSVIYSLPFAVQPLRNAFQAVGDRPLEAAATLGAGPWDAFLTVAVLHLFVAISPGPAVLMAARSALGEDHQAVLRQRRAVSLFECPTA